LDEVVHTTSVVAGALLGPVFVVLVVVVVVVVDDQLPSHRPAVTWTVTACCGVVGSDCLDGCSNSNVDTAVPVVVAGNDDEDDTMVDTRFARPPDLQTNVGNKRSDLSWTVRIMTDQDEDDKKTEPKARFAAQYYR